MTHIYKLIKSMGQNPSSEDVFARQFKKFSGLAYGTSRFTTVLKGTPHWPRPEPDECSQHPIILRSILILPFHLSLDILRGRFPSNFMAKSFASLISQR
jgi:hypothetical protein